MTKQRAMINSIAANTVAFLLLFNIFSVLAHISYNPVRPLHLLLAVPFYFLCWLMRRVGSPGIFLVWYIGIVVATLIAGNIAYGGPIVSFASGETVFIFMSLVTIRFIVVWFNGCEVDLGSSGTSTAIALLFAHVGLYVLVLYFGVYSGTLFLQISLTYLLMLLLVLLCTHLSNIEYRMAFIQVIENYHQPTGRVYSANNRLLVIFIGIALSIGAVLELFLTRFYRWIADRGILFFERTEEIFVFFVDDIGAEYAEVYEEYTLLSEYVELIVQDLNERIWGSIGIYHAMALVLIIFAIVYTTILVGKLANKEWYRSKTKRSGKDAVTGLETSLLDDLLSLLPKGKRLFQHPIRRVYAKKINRHIRRGTYISLSDTTGIIGNKIRPDENIDELTAMYEKVRYGRKESLT